MLPAVRVCTILLRLRRVTESSACVVNMRLAVNAVMVLWALGTLSCKDSSGPAEQLYEPDVRWSEISAGGGDFTGYTCGRTDVGKVYCWGDELSAAIVSGPGGETRAPSRLKSGLLFRAIAVGYRHACGITTDGAHIAGATGASTISDKSHRPLTESTAPPLTLRSQAGHGVRAR